MKLTTQKTERGDWKVKGMPLVICKSPMAPKFGESQEWYIAMYDEGYREYGDGRPVAGDYDSKRDALDGLEMILQAASTNA